MGRLDGKVAIITGASTGLGPVMAKAFVREGAKCVLAARKEELVMKAAEEAGEGAIGMRADVSREEDVAAMVDLAMREFGQVDCMMNNAAVPGTDKYVWEQTLDNWNTTIAIDVTAAMLCTREVLNRSMMARKTGTIVNFSSSAGFTGLARKTHYSTAKAALRALTITVAREVGPMGIRCNCIVPSIDTELARNYRKRIAGEQGRTYEDVTAEHLLTIPLRHVPTSEEVTELCLFLASDESSAITGQLIHINGGNYMPG
jgi:NAD(P)-dependent dehydrogenase (short-subunit alcohol dehydrogenase family)